MQTPAFKLHILQFAILELFMIGKVIIKLGDAYIPFPNEASYPIPNSGKTVKLRKDVKSSVNTLFCLPSLNTLPVGLMIVSEL